MYLKKFVKGSEKNIFFLSINYQYFLSYGRLILLVSKSDKNVVLKIKMLEDQKKNLLRY